MRTVASKVLLVLLIGYWGAFALITPITIWDSNTYNIARIPLALEGGLFGNPSWNSDRQVAFPWGFDALHLVFFWIGGGAALPSYLCFLGTLAIVWTIIRTHYGESLATLCALGAFAMPTFVYQATSTKNDLAVVFGIACWFYALWLHRRLPSRWLPWGMALSLAFAAGAKSSGVPLVILAALGTVYALRKHLGDALRFAVGLLVAMLLWGSVETYVNNVRVYGKPLGPTSLIEGNRNIDGLRGAAANAIRYAFESVNIGTDTRGRVFAAKQCRRVLRAVRLRDVGYRSEFNDLNFAFAHKGWEAGSDFGLLGFISLTASAGILLRGKWRTVEWKLAAAGFVGMGIVCMTIAWMPWNMRFLMMSFLLFSIAFILRIKAHLACKPWLKTALFILILHGIFVYPLGSFNKTPRDLWAAIVRRDSSRFKERPGMKEVMDVVRQAMAQEKMSVLFLDAGGDSWVLPFFQINNLKVVPSPNLTATPTFRDAERNGRVTGLLVLNHSFVPDQEKSWKLYRKFSEPDSALYLWRSP